MLSVNHVTRVVVGVVVLAIWSADAVRADTLELRDGTVINGTYVGGTAGTVRFQTPEGVKVVKTADVLAVTFESAEQAAHTPGAAPQPMLPQPSPSGAAVVAAPRSVIVPPGTLLTVRMVDSVSSNDTVGRTFNATLISDLAVGDVTVAKRGTKVAGRVEKAKKAGRLAGKSELALTLTGVEIGGKVHPILTTNFADAGQGEFRKTARNTAAGALIGHAIDDDGGAGTGAAIGLGASAVTKGEAVTVPNGAIVEFRLTQPLQVQVAG